MLITENDYNMRRNTLTIIQCKNVDCNKLKFAFHRRRIRSGLQLGDFSLFLTLHFKHDWTFSFKHDWKKLVFFFVSTLLDFEKFVKLKL